MPRQPSSAGELRFALWLAREIKARRIGRKWSQEQLAREAGVSTANVRRLESGTAPATSFVTVGRLSRSLDISLDTLFAGFPEEDR